MREYDSNVDLSIQLQPISEPFNKSKPRRRTVFYLLVAGGVLLSLAAFLAIIGMLRQFAGASNVTVTAQQDPQSQREEAVRTFRAYDAANERNRAFLPADQRERDEIIKLFDRIQACAACPPTS